MGLTCSVDLHRCYSLTQRKTPGQTLQTTKSRSWWRTLPRSDVSTMVRRPACPDSP
jgi:hypothetical protein